MDYVDRVNKTTLDPALLIEASGLHPDSSTDHFDFTDATIATTELLAQKGIQGRLRQDFLLAIQFRMTALAAILESGAPEANGFSFRDQKSGAVFINDTLFKAAACVPLIERDNQAHFDRRVFFEEVLRISETSGGA